ncbi:OLC1v1001463C1 [Oldenlandia corymbosa var. corymbosa]|uniref:OLC1v1001463C1 n=1 Tax=Oldenlandia corymbosa var. corymbosa TaxID=529605 RepID=A0AAV1D5C5_OLDCO|nr:OLC1v1001463C1 [Oldenlandia corymbosa var. corymbosa]
MSENLIQCCRMILAFPYSLSLLIPGVFYLVVLQDCGYFIDDKLCSLPKQHASYAIVEIPTHSTSEKFVGTGIPTLSKSFHSELDKNNLDLCIRNSEESPRKPGMDDHDDKTKKGKYKDKPARWNQIKTELNAALGVPIDVHRIKSKVDRLKHDWKTWLKIKYTTGVGWNEELGVFEYPHWAALNTKIVGAIKFRDKPFPHIDALTELFHDQTGTMENGATPSYRPGDEVTDTTTDDSPELPRARGKRPVETAPFGVDSRGTKKSKGDEPSFQSALQMYHDVQKQKHNRISTKVEPAKTTIEVLYAMELTPDDFWKVVVEFNKEKHKALIFLTLRTEKKYEWIKHTNMNGAGPSSYPTDSDEEMEDISSNDNNSDEDDFMDLLMLHIMYQYEQRLLNAQYLAPPMSGAQYVQRVLHHSDPRKLRSAIQLNHAMYYALWSGLVDYGLWVENSNTKVHIDEALFMFMYTVATKRTTRDIVDRFEHSLETMSRNLQDMADAIARDHFPAYGDEADDIVFQTQHDANGPYVMEYQRLDQSRQGINRWNEFRDAVNEDGFPPASATRYVPYHHFPKGYGLTMISHRLPDRSALKMMERRLLRQRLTPAAQVPNFPGSLICFVMFGVVDYEWCLGDGFWNGKMARTRVEKMSTPEPNPASSSGSSLDASERYKSVNRNNMDKSLPPTQPIEWHNSSPSHQDDNDEERNSREEKVEASTYAAEVRNGKRNDGGDDKKAKKKTAATKYEGKNKAKKENVAQNKQHIKEILKFQSRVSPTGAFKIFSVLDDGQIKLAQETGFGHLLSLGISQLSHPVLSLYLLCNFMFNNKTLLIQGGRQLLKITEEDVEAVLGLPRGPKIVVEAYDSLDKSEDQEEYRNLFGFGSGEPLDRIAVPKRLDEDEPTQTKNDKPKSTIGEEMRKRMVGHAQKKEEVQEEPQVKSVPTDPIWWNSPEMLECIRTMDQVIKEAKRKVPELSDGSTSNLHISENVTEHQANIPDANNVDGKEFSAENIQDFDGFTPEGDATVKIAIDFARS